MCPNKCSGGLSLTIDEVPEDSESNLFRGKSSSVENQLRLLVVLDLKDRIDHVEDRLALLVHDLDVGKADLALTRSLE